MSAAEEIGLMDLSNYFHAIVSVALFLLANVQVDRKGNNQLLSELLMHGANAGQFERLRDCDILNYLNKKNPTKTRSHLWTQLTSCLMNVRSRQSHTLFMKYYFIQTCSPPYYIANFRFVCCFLKWSNFFFFLFPPPSSNQCTAE